MRFVRYEQWSNLSRGATRASHPIGSTRGVTLHWEGPHMGSFPHATCAEHVRGIQRFHRETRGWADIAYNAVVCPHGYVYEGRGAGVTSAANGDTGPNDTHYAACYLGGEGDGFTDDGKVGFHDAVDWLRREGDAGREVNGHRDHKATACPGDEIYRWLQSHDFNNPAQEDDDMPAYSDWPAKDRKALADDVAKAVLDADMNAHEPKGDEDFRGVSLRQVVKRIARAVGKE